MGKQRIGLEDHADIAVGRRQMCDVGAVDQDRAARCPLQPGDQPQGRGLAASRRTKERDETALLDDEGDIVDRRHPAVALEYRAELDGGAPLGHRAFASGKGANRRLSCRSPTRNWIAEITPSISTISTEA